MECIIVIWIRVLELHQRLEHKTSTPPLVGIVEFGLRLIVFPKNFLKKWIQKKDNEAPKYLQGKNR